MAEDEFKDVGRYLGDDEWAELPMGAPPNDFTVIAWFIWLSGDGPLFVSDNDEVAFVYDHDGLCAYRLGSVERVTSVTVDAARDTWIFLGLSREGEEVTFLFNGEVVDRWDGPVSGRVSKAFVMKHAVGFAADISYWDRRVPDNRVGILWDIGKRRV